MRRKRRQRDTLSVSLFPFLAVLICTVGVLIVMLVIAVKSADSTANAKAEVEQQEFETAREKLSSRLDLATLRLDGLQEMRPDVVQRLSSAREVRSHLQEEIRKLEWNSELLLSQYREIERQRNLQDHQQQQADLEQSELDKQLDSLRQSVQLAEKQLEDDRNFPRSDAPVTYSIVPYEGRNGTNRRPIYIECDPFGVTLQPLGIQLTEDDLRPPHIPGNPLDAALIAIREYWERYDLAGDEGVPYPLLIVRSGGAYAYTAARRAMASWDDEFGYELVDAEKNLDFGEPDLQLAGEVRQAVEQGRIRHRAVAANAQQRVYGAPIGAGGRPGRNSAGGLIVSDRNGGFVNPDGSPAVTARQAGGSSSQGNRGSRVQTAGSFGQGPAAGRVEQASLLQPGNSRSTNGEPIAANLANGESSLPGSGAFRPAASSQTAQSNGGQASGTHAPGGQASGGQASAGQASSSQASSSQAAGSQATNPQTGAAQAGGSAAGSSASAIADSRGEQWALPSRTPGATAYLRPVSIVCSGEGLTINSAGLKEPTYIPFHENTQSAVGELVETIWQKIDSWGPAGNNAYWKPELQLIVRRNGHQRARDLRRMFERSGFDIQETYE